MNRKITFSCSLRMREVVNSLPDHLGKLTNDGTMDQWIDVEPLASNLIVVTLSFCSLHLHKQGLSLISLKTEMLLCNKINFEHHAKNIQFYLSIYNG